jgi:hypothetical protein
MQGRDVNPASRLALGAILVLGLLVYWVGLAGPLLFDDSDNLRPVAAWLEGRTDWLSVVFGNTSGLFGRPVSMLSFVLNGALLGPGVWGLKLGNVLIHLANGALVFVLFRALIRCGALTRASDRSAAWLPLLGAALWLLHPLMVSTVLYVVQRMAMLSALFILLALIAYVHGRVVLDEGRRNRALLLLVAIVPLCTVLATLSKENGILAPALCAVIEWLVFQPARGVRRAWLSRAFIGAALVLPALVALVLTVLQVPAIVDGYANRPFTLIERLLTQPRVLWDYVGALVLPNGPHLGIYHDDYAVSHGLFDPATTALAILAWLGLIGVAWRLRRPIPGLAFGLGIFLVGHALESTVFPLLIYFEHRNYLPAVGLIWAMLAVATFAADAASPHMRNAARIFPAAACALVLVLAAATAARASVWRSHHAIMQQALEFHPDSRWLRQDLIAEAMGKRPPDFGAVRTHARHLFESADPSTRRLGAIELVLVDCTAGNAADPAQVDAAFAGRPEPLEPDLVAVFKLLGARLANSPCAGLSAGEAASKLVVLADRSMLDVRNTALQQLRFQAAKLYATGGQRGKALAQAELADHDDAQVSAFIAQMQIR